MTDWYWVNVPWERQQYVDAFRSAVTQLASTSVVTPMGSIEVGRTIDRSRFYKHLTHARFSLWIMENTGASMLWEGSPALFYANRQTALEDTPWMAGIMPEHCYTLELDEDRSPRFGFSNPAHAVLFKLAHA